ncbi:hypothetical protein LTR97_004583 [Elasticomyces elasticus]|uniref:Uncharacterized protein n=1 Tax=Elasticomyces elasticus TaxID=574655 RepID=A0AAN7W8Q3_9PEZI|nr:hypothetical protein LTR97_004583 [Elasticomyces elasticus]
MAPSRGNKPKTPAKKTTTAGPSRRSARNRKNEEAPEIFQDLLAEAAVVDSEHVSERPLKRRRVASGVVLPSPSPRAPSRSVDSKGKGKVREVEEEREAAESDVSGKLQTIEQSSSSDDEDEEEDEDGFDFEDIDLNQLSASTNTNGIQDLSISLPTSATPGKRQQPKTKRKPGTSLLEKSHRLLVHKAHVLCLLGHCMFINTWCNVEIVQRNLEAVLTEKTKLFLRANSRESQFDRNAMFMDGLQQATEQFRGRFRITSSGLHRPRWSDIDEPNGSKGEGVAEPMDRSDFISASRKLAGSQDTGNQLFCALLRGVGVEARVVCSLQVLPFGSVAVKAAPVKVVKKVVYASAAASGTDHSASDGSADDRSVGSSASVGRVPGVRRRLGQPSFASTTTPTPTEQRKAVKKLAYPVFWTEAFNPAHQKWIPVDPIVTGTWNKPSKLEPPGSYPDNQMSYVVAFESDGVARDVTRRYTKAFNAKTRRSRVEATDGGAGWWKRALKLFRRRGGKLDREQVEDAEMAGREAREGMPGNVADFKGHPVYALERHLRRGEVVWPRREVGKVNAGTAKRARMEGVFRREDVVVVRSGEKWYRVGRVVKVGEQALKHVRAAARVVGKRAQDSDGEEEEEERTTGLYAEFQTEVYVPPAVVKGKVPRNKFGNLDVYVPSMVPGGGVHVRHLFAKAAARELGVDFVDAVVGFSFKGRQGTAVVDGGVIAEEYAGKVREVVEGLVVEAKEARERERSKVALAVWGRMMKGLRIRERVRGYAGEGGEEGEVAVEDQTAALRAGGRDDEELSTAGRYTLEDLVSGKAKAQAAKKRRRKVEESEAEEEEEGGFEREDGDEDDELAPTPRRSLRSRRKVVEEDEDEEVGNADHVDDEGGGFLAEDADEEGGGFLPDAGDADDDGSGGFVPEETGGMEGGGGFLAEDSGDGGGFMVDPAENEHEQGMADAADHESGGGFLPDADASSPAHLDASHGTDVAGGQAEAPTLAPPFRHIDENAAKMANGGHEDDHNHTTVVPKPHASQQPPRPLNGTQDAMKDGQQDVALLGSPKEAEDAIDTAPNGMLSAEGDAEVQSDQDSLLSHDPEDEDAEPDWLESD